MRPTDQQPSRRGFLQGGAALAALGTLGAFAPGAFADQLASTPPLTEGPFYPRQLPLDTDNDLIIINDRLTPAVGTIAHVGGRVLSPSGSPLRNVLVEIWQCDARGVYHHVGGGGGQGQRDANFQGYGRFLTGLHGEYYFRTIRPVPYPGRTPHIHFKLKQGNRELLTTQLFIAGHEQNNRDGIFLDSGNPIARELVQADFRALPGSRLGEQTARFDIVLGRTPAES
jgi:protocatechuate 3,4-dioxygenase beta subunit